MHKDYTSKKGIKAIAIFEMVKGVLGLIVGITLTFLLHSNLTAIAEQILDVLHVDASGHFAQMFVEKVSHINESNILVVIIIAFVYTLVRMIEGYGLWHLRPWAEWFAIISGGIYLPFEIYEIFHKPSILKFAILLGNILIVLYLIYVRWESNYQKKHPTEIPNLES